MKWKERKKRNFFINIFANVCVQYLLLCPKPGPYIYVRTLTHTLTHTHAHTQYTSKIQRITHLNTVALSWISLRIFNISVHHTKKNQPYTRIPSITWTRNHNGQYWWMVVTAEKKKHFRLTLSIRTLRRVDFDETAKYKYKKKNQTIATAYNK